MNAPPRPLLLAALLLTAGATPDADKPVGETYAVLKDGTRLQLFAEKSDPTPVARVGTSVVTLRELTDALATVHQEHASQSAGGKDFAQVLDRLVNVRLVVLEAEAMGIPELPEFRSAMAVAEERMLREALKRKTLAGVKADPRDLERASRDVLREWTLRPVLFEKEADARAFRKRLDGGTRFEDALAKAVADKKAKGRVDPQPMRETQLPPALRKALRGLSKGQATAPVKVEGGFVVAQMLGKRQVDDPQERAKVRASVEAATRVDAMRAYYLTLVKKYARVDEKLLRAIDFEAEKPGLEALAQDERTLAQIQGEEPITVARLVTELRKKFFHGPERQQRKGALNAQARTTFDDLLEKRLFAKEARAQGLQDQPEYKYQLQQFADQLALSAAVERAVLPALKVTDDDLRRYYREHEREFAAPATFRLDGIAFARAADAQEALRKLRAGTDLKWLRANAEGQLPLDEAGPRLDGSAVAVSDMPEALGQILAEARTGDYRLYAAPGGAQYAIQVVERLPPQIQPFESVKDTIQTTVLGRKLNEAFQQWAGTLRQHYPVEILIARFGS